MVIVNDLPYIWSEKTAGWQEKLEAIGGKVIEIYPTREEAQKALEKIIARGL